MRSKLHEIEGAKVDKNQFFPFFISKKKSKKIMSIRSDNLIALMREKSSSQVRVLII